MKKKILSLIGTLAIFALMVLNVQFSTNITSGNTTLSNHMMKAYAISENSGEDDFPGNWDAEYPECEFTVTYGIPGFLQIQKKFRGSYRNCVSGWGTCLWNDNACCLRIGGVCTF